ncbi:unknown [Clostridium sp. CAG:762]|nr:unknown [Clostridium sp. CAG:762]
MFKEFLFDEMVNDMINDVVLMKMKLPINLVSKTSRKNETN